MLVIPRNENGLIQARGHRRLAKTVESFRRAYGPGVDVSERGDSVVLEGSTQTWALKVEAGWAAARLGYKGVVNDLAVPGAADEALEAPAARDGLLDGLSFDAAVIGGGVVGAAIARELSRYEISVVLLEKEGDVAVHTSSRNDGMIHDGFAATPGTRKAAYNVRGNRLWEPLCKELGVDFRRPGSLILFRTAASAAAYPLMAARARRNAVDGWEYWNQARVSAEEPNIAAGHHGGFFLPSAGVLSPYKATVALAESAALNGVRVVLGACALGLELEGGRVARVRTNRGTFRAGAVINAAGNWADVVAGMAGDRFFSLHQRRGTDLILDAATGGLQRHIMSMPSLMQAKSKTKGGGLITTVEGNVLVGPTACESPGREDYATRPEELAELERHLKLNSRLGLSQVITYFSGVRPCTYEEDFIVERSDKVPNLVHAAGIQSPGLASAPAIAQDVAAMTVAVLSEIRDVRPRAGWIAERRAPPDPRRLGVEARDALIRRAPVYGRVVCRCEEVSEGEIVDALGSILPAAGLDAVKRRTRAGMGRCHGGFCTPRVVEIMARKTGEPLWAIAKKGPGSELFTGPTKGARLTKGARP